MIPECETLEPRWDSPCIVAATGQSLSKKVAEACRGYPTIVVKQAWMRLPWADVLYACDAYWWQLYQGAKKFEGERWSSHDPSMNPKLDAAKTWKLRLVRGDQREGFSTDPRVIYYGQNAGYQAIGMALHWLKGPRKTVVLIGFDMHGGYFFGDHPKGKQHGGRFHSFLPHYEKAAKILPEGVEIINCSQGSLLKCFGPIRQLEDVLMRDAA